MTTDARAALDRLVAALEAHLAAAEQRRGEQDPHVEQAYRTLADAFETYDEALYDAHDEVTPFVLYDDVEDLRDDDEDEDEDEDDEDEDDEDDEDDIEDVDEDDLSDDEDDDLPEVEDEVEDDDMRTAQAPSGAQSGEETSSRA